MKNRSYRFGLGWKLLCWEFRLDLIHELLPGPGGFATVALGLRVVVVTKPNGGGELGNGADEPDIASPL